MTTDIAFSLSEYGCNTNTRDFGEVKALYSTDMTGVYSGGLVYEYSQEANDFGLVTIKGGSVSELPDFKALKTAFSNTPAPQGDGGYSTSGSPSKCPARSSTWLPDTDALPAIPSGAVKFMTQGAGKGPGPKGNDGAGSQNAGGASTGTATAGSGTPSQTATGGSSTSSGAASSVRVPELTFAPFAVALIAGCISFLGIFLV